MGIPLGAFEALQLVGDVSTIEIASIHTLDIATSGCISMRIDNCNVEGDKGRSSDRRKETEDARLHFEVGFCNASQSLCELVKL